MTSVLTFRALFRDCVLRTRYSKQLLRCLKNSVAVFKFLVPQPALKHNRRKYHSDKQDPEPLGVVCLMQLNFGIALSSISVLRYATDYGNDLPLGVMARMLDTHDTIVQLVPLLEERPWMRRWDVVLLVRWHLFVPF